MYKYHPSTKLTVHLDMDGVTVGTKVNDVWEDGSVFALYIGTLSNKGASLNDFFTVYVTKEQLLQLQASLQADVHEHFKDAMTA
jgi:hypothetical protein